ncbi:hypothetical protein HN681_01500 [archaeon]|nr:hypothetical protein [archaeon]MBT3730552.1 hypothetical protein [archaeon]MBT4669454.1 hypothetical protein [archaeon]MBT5030211.1 hypothetical protein [archaeon]MBT5287690.1 hypothetical protein [archaeon]
MVKKDNMGVVLGILIGILVLSMIFVFSMDDGVADDVYKYSNGNTIFEVYKYSDTETYITFLAGVDDIEYTLGLRTDPLSLEDIPVTGTLHTRIFDDEIVYVTIDPYANLTGQTVIAALEVDKVIDNEYLYQVPVMSAMTREYSDYPVKNCDDGTNTETIVYLTLGDETKVYTYDYCIIIMGTDEAELIRAADRMLYTLLGIMQ